MTEQLRDGHGRFASGGMNELFRAKSGVRVDVTHPESHDVMNDRLRGVSSDDDGDDISELEAATPPQVDGLDGGAGRGSRLEPDESSSEIMNRALRVASGREPPGVRTAPNGLPIRD